MALNMLLVSIAGSLVTAVLYLYVGHVLRQRKVSDAARLANGMFVLWWQALGGLGLLGACIFLLYLAGGLEVWIYQTYLTLVLLGLFVALWGLQFYLMYLYTGSKKSFIPLAVFYGILFVATMALVAYQGVPERITDDGWSLKTDPEPPELGRAFSLAFALVIIGPQLVAAIAYASLYAKAKDRTQKYRILLVTGSIIVWFGSGLVASGAQVSDNLTYQLFSRVIGILGALVILMAYKPPKWIRSKYGIRGIDDEAAAQAELPSGHTA